ncbi:MAG: YkgJ family cysteine cluster protein [Bacillota bacterium]
MIADVIEISRCKGHCCRAFTLPYSPEELEGLKNKTICEESDFYKVPRIVEYIGSFAFDVAGNLLPYEMYWYTCKHFNKETGDCMNYENRPYMCKDFPYWGSYRLKSCTYRECEMKVEFEYIWEI